MYCIDDDHMKLDAVHDEFLHEPLDDDGFDERMDNVVDSSSINSALYAHFFLYVISEDISYTEHSSEEMLKHLCLLKKKLTNKTFGNCN